jgi:RimJ/RimL family protein N-acetyltransferase
MRDAGSQDRPHFAVTIDSIDGQTIGCGGFRNFSEDASAEISVIIGEPTFWAKGIAKEAMHLMLDYGFNEMQLDRIWLIVRADNERGVGLFEGLGFRVSETIKAAVIVDGSPKDKFRMLLSKFEWVR